MGSHKQIHVQWADITIEKNEKLPAREMHFLKTTGFMLNIPRDASDGYESNL